MQKTMSDADLAYLKKYAKVAIDPMTREVVETPWGAQSTYFEPEPFGVHTKSVTETERPGITLANRAVPRSFEEKSKTRQVAMKTGPNARPHVPPSPMRMMSAPKSAATNGIMNNRSGAGAGVAKARPPHAGGATSRAGQPSGRPSSRAASATRQIGPQELAQINALYNQMAQNGYFMRGIANGLSQEQQNKAIAWGHALRAAGFVKDRSQGFRPVLQTVTVRPSSQRTQSGHSTHAGNQRQLAEYASRKKKEIDYHNSLLGRGADTLSYFHNPHYLQDVGKVFKSVLKKSSV